MVEETKEIKQDPVTETALVPLEEGASAEEKENQLVEKDKVMKLEEVFSSVNGICTASIHHQKKLGMLLEFLPTEQFINDTYGD